MIATGFEPVTVCLEGRCSIQLSYATIQGLTTLILKIDCCKKRCFLQKLQTIFYENKFSTKSYLSFLSGWQDSNLRPPRPKRGAITGLRYTPKIGYLIAERPGFEPGQHLRVDRLAICSITTLAPLQNI